MATRAAVWRSPMTVVWVLPVLIVAGLLTLFYRVVRSLLGELAATPA